MPELPRI